MSEFFFEYGLFLAKTLTLVVGILAVVGLSVAMATVRQRDKDKGELHVSCLNDEYRGMTDVLRMNVLDKEAQKKLSKQEKADAKAAKKQAKIPGEPEKPRVFVIDFDGDIRASQVDSLRQCITAVLGIATPEDEVVLRLESPGGQVHGYGLAASQLVRVRDRNIPLTVAVDKVAASGGYLMACVADRILAAPFAVVGSIGVVAQIPNFNRLLRKHQVDYEMVTAGEHKRTITMFGRNTDAGRAKFQEELEDTHVLFKDFVREHRPRVDIEELGTGEHWFGSRAQKLRLVDELRTSDDYLLSRAEDADLYEISYEFKKGLGERFGSFVESSFTRISSLWRPL